MNLKLAPEVTATAESSIQIVLPAQTFRCFEVAMQKKVEFLELHKI